MKTIELTTLIGESSFKLNSNTKQTQENDQPSDDDSQENAESQQKYPKKSLTIHLARIHTNTNQFFKVVTVRKLVNFDSADDTAFSEIILENKRFSLLKHRNLLSLEVHDYIPSSFIHKNTLFTVTEYCGYGSVYDLVNAHYSSGLPFSMVVYIFYGVLKALEYLHQNFVIHRSIRAEHVLIDRYGVVKVSGFRQMLELENKNSVFQNSGFDFNNSHGNRAFHYNGSRDVASIRYYAPEVLGQTVNGYSYNSDVYSLSILLCFICNGKLSFDEFANPRILLEKMYGQKAFVIDSKTAKQLLSDSSDCEKFSEDVLTRCIPEVFHTAVSDMQAYCDHHRPSVGELLRKFPLFDEFEVGSEWFLRSVPDILLPVKPAFLSAIEQRVLEVETRMSFGKDGRVFVEDFEEDGREVQNEIKFQFS
jgi:serine/threonine protein kinase